MDIVISPKSEKPIYEQIYDQMVSQILNKVLKPNECLPSIRVVAKELGISVITIKKAWEMLEANGFIYTRAGLGCFINDHTEQKLDDKRIQIAKKILLKDIMAFKDLGLSVDEVVDIIKKEY